ncbi:MAG: bifunctional diaminohydroxyphosphoribosylaminopyrimidine deaminase/5-amino-6-(5-phosphoribosylamino)uracil reductase RibD [Nitriliruptoraceae bacterium]
MPPLLPLNPTDRHFLQQAFAYAHADGTPTAPNPRVGCLIVAANGTIISQTVSAPAGGPHAEVIALDQAGSAAAGATVYVTLEPCDHYGRTPPCTTRLHAANVARVVYALSDDNPLAGGGAATLQANGIAIAGPLAATDPLFDAISSDLHGFITVVAAHRPQITLKLAQDPDGNTKPGQTAYLTGAKARRSVHRMRALTDAVLVGAGTVTADDPQLNVRDTGSSMRVGSRATYQPRAVVLDRRLQSPPDAAVFRNGTILITTDDHDPARLVAYRNRGVNVRQLQATGDDVDDVTNALNTLAQEGINQVFAEPGLTLAQTLVDAHVVDRLVLHVAGFASTATFTPCVPLDDFRLHASGRFDTTDFQFTFVPNRKNP